MDPRKRPRLYNNEGESASSSPYAPSTTAAAAAVLQTEIRTLRAELEHSQQIRSIERKNADRSEQRLRRQLADALEEAEENKELIDSLREELDRHNQQMEESREEWLERIQWYEEQLIANDEDEDIGANSVVAANNKKCGMLEKRLNAKDDQIGALEEQLRVALQEAATARKELQDKNSIIEQQQQQIATGGGNGSGLLMKIPHRRVICA